MASTDEYILESGGSESESGSSEISVGSSQQRQPSSLKERNPSKYSSEIYGHYFKNEGDDADVFRCVECNSVVKKGGGGQSNLKKHLRRYHKERFQNLDKPVSEL